MHQGGDENAVTRSCSRCLQVHALVLACFAMNVVKKLNIYIHVISELAENETETVMCLITLISMSTLVTIAF